jgi:hypothetical protein
MGMSDVDTGVSSKGEVEDTKTVHLLSQSATVSEYTTVEDTCLMEHVNCKKTRVRP